MSADWRDQVIAEAKSWIGTPYHHAANLKGVGVDCCMLLVEVYRAVGIIPPDFDPRPYPQHWFLHRGEELFMEGMFRYAKRLARGQRPQPADVALYRVGRTASHGAIVLDQERMIHAYAGSARVEIGELYGWERKLDSYWTVL